MERAQLRDTVARHRVAQQDARLSEAAKAAKADRLNQAETRVVQLTHYTATLERQLATAQKKLQRAYKRTNTQKRRAEMWRKRALDKARTSA